MSPAVRIFPLARMSPLIRGLTLVMLALPLILLLVGWRDDVASPMLNPVALGLLFLYPLVWLFWRPAHFELNPDSLLIVWPLRRRDIPLRSIARASLIDRHEFRERFGKAMRVGIGGLWGQFGYSWTSAAGLVDTYLSTMGPWVLVELKEGRPLLISPEEPATFVRELGYDH